MNSYTHKNTESKLLTDGNNNEKLKKTGKQHKVQIVAFNLPVRKTCPMAKYCLSDCYAYSLTKRYKSCATKYQYNYEQSLKDDFVARINDELSNDWYLATYVRIHSSGDFYSVEYLDKWVKIAMSNPSITFYAYTKSVSIVKDYESKNGLPKNLSITYSYGGVEDHLIDPKIDKHAIVIDDKADVPIGYVDGSNDDFKVIFNKNVALKYHGKHKWENSDFRLVKLPI